MLLLAGVTATAQRNETKGRQHTMKDLSPEQIATLQTKKMTLALDLNEEQQTKMKALFASNAVERKAHMEARKAKKENDEKMTAVEKYTMENKRLDHKIAQKKEMKQLLNDEQYAKWEKMQYKRGMHRKGKDKEGKRRER